MPQGERSLLRIIQQRLGTSRQFMTYSQPSLARTWLFLLEEHSDRGKHVVDEKRADVESAVRAGREAVKERIEKYSS